MTSTLSASSVASTAEMSVPSSIVPPLGRRETEVWSGTARPACANASRAPKTAALTSRMSCAVSMIRRSDPPSIRPLACSAKISTSSRKRILPSVGSSEAGRWPVGPIEPATKRSSPMARARDLGGLAVDLVGVLAEPPLVQLQAGRLERVRLHDLGADLDHGAVEVLDDVGAVEDERLVRAAGQLVVLLEREVELLERGAHAPVEDDDAVTGGCQVVAHRRGSLANLDKVVARLGCADCNPDVKPVRRPAAGVSR